MTTYNTLSVVNEIIFIIEEKFYGLDIEFDSTNCVTIFFEIRKMFIEKNILNLYKICMTNYIEKCLNDIDINSSCDYKLFLNNLDKLVDNKNITYLDLENLENTIYNKLNIENTKKLVLSNIS